MNIKRGLKRLWVVGSVLLVIGVISMTMDTFPERPKETKLGEMYKSETSPYLTHNFRQVPSPREKLKQLKLMKREYEKDKKESLLISLWGLGVLIFMWGSLYTGIWISSGLSSYKKKDETNE
jgi:hypothetical protein